MLKKTIITSLILAPIVTFAQEGVSISNSGVTPDASAMLDVISNNKGLLIPRVNLTSTNVASPITNPTKSLLVYNSNTSGTGSTAVVEGFYFWDGTQWIPFVVENNSGGSGTDDQNIMGSGLNGTILTIGIENGSSQTVDLSSLVNDADSNPSNEFNTSLSLSGTTLNLVDGGGTKSVNLASLQDGTGSDNQTLSISGSTLTISGGNSISLPSSGGSSDADWYKAGTSYAPSSISNNIYTNGKVGIGLNNPSEKLEISSGNIELSTNYAIGHGLGSSSEYAIYLRKNSINSMTGLGSLSPTNTNAMTLESDQLIGIVETDANALLGYYNLDLSSSGNNLKYIWTGATGLGTNNPKFKLHVKGDIGNVRSGILIEDDPDAVLYGKTGSSTREFTLIGAFKNWDNKAIYLGGYNINNTWGPGYDDANKVIVGGGGSGASLPIYATSFVVSSTKRVKENIAKINYGINEIMTLNPVTYNYTFDKSKRSEIGFIAEEVNLSLPQLVYKDESNNALGMDYSKITAVLVKAMQEQQELIKKLEKRINDLENSNK